MIVASDEWFGGEAERKATEKIRPVRLKRFVVDG